MKFDAIIIGAGAAGLFCAAEAGKRGRKVLIIEHNAQVGRKILISGGGRCNFTNREVKPENFVSRNPHFCKSALARYTSGDFIELVNKHKIEFYEKTLGQLFCKDSSRQIVQLLLIECEDAKVRINTNCTITSVSKNEFYEVETNQGVFQTESLVIATGGLSFPKIGATDFGYKIAKQFGLKIIEPRPALVPLIFADEKAQGFSKLAGVSFPTNAAFRQTSFAENALFTHRGLSGPAVLQISNYWQPKQPVEFDFLPSHDVATLLKENSESRQQLNNFLAQFLPSRFADLLCVRLLPNKPLYQLNDREISQIAETLNNFAVRFNQTEGYDKAEVTLGGVDTRELSSQTMEAKNVKGLYFIGEIVDVTGWLGGYNFQWAWSSGFATAQVL